MMLTRKSAIRAFWLLAASAVMLVAAENTWKDKPTSEWTDQDAHQILTDSPWAKTIRATIAPLQTEDERRAGGNMGLPRGIGFDGFPDDRPRPRVPTGPIDALKPENDTRTTRFFTLQLRWESALPIRVAELKSHALAPPASADDAYIMAVYGVPTANVKGDPRTLGEPLRGQAALRREGKKDVRPSSVEVFQGEDGMVIVYIFPLSAEITKKDQRVEFEARIGRLGVAQSFSLEEMQFQGSLAL